LLPDTILHHGHAMLTNRHTGRSHVFTRSLALGSFGRAITLAQGFSFRDGNIRSSSSSALEAMTLRVALQGCGDGL
jgi:hypothetical protein